MDCAPVIKAKRNHMDLKISFASISSYGVLNFKCCTIIFMNVVIIEAFFFLDNKIRINAIGNKANLQNNLLSAPSFDTKKIDVLPAN